MTDRQFERWIAILLRAGVITAAAIVLLGGTANLMRHSGLPSYRPFHGEPEQYKSAPGILASALHGDVLAWIQLGLLVLIATPVARVALAILGFSLERDWIYVAITTLVLAILLYSLI